MYTVFGVATDTLACTWFITYNIEGMQFIRLEVFSCVQGPSCLESEGSQKVIESRRSNLMLRKAPMTAAGFEKLKVELKHYKTVERPNVIEAISEARAHGDLSENAEYDAAKEKQGFVEAHILELENAVATAEVVDPTLISSDIVAFGATVELQDSETGENFIYQIVGDLEGNPAHGSIAVSSPVARALLGRMEGDEATVHLPDGKRYLEILGIRYE